MQNRAQPSPGRPLASRRRPQSRQGSAVDRVPVPGPLQHVSPAVLRLHGVVIPAWLMAIRRVRLGACDRVAGPRVRLLHV